MHHPLRFDAGAIHLMALELRAFDMANGITYIGRLGEPSPLTTGYSLRDSIAVRTLAVVDECRNHRGVCNNLNSLYGEIYRTATDYSSRSVELFQEYVVAIHSMENGK